MYEQRFTLKNLYAFATVARHQSIAKAAQQLHVTPAAISQQIKQLEENIGEKLFTRTTRKLELTVIGKTALPVINQALAHFETVDQHFSYRSQEQNILLSVSPSFGLSWLVPRLEQFYRRHPELNVHIDASDNWVDFQSNPSAIAIRHGKGHYPETQTRLLIKDKAIVVASPTLLRQFSSPLKPAELLKQNLIHVNWKTESESAPTWEKWATKHSLPVSGLNAGISYTMEEMAVRAAIAGVGFAIVSQAFVADDLDAGRLVRVLSEKYDMETDFHHYVVWSSNANLKKEQSVFLDWLFNEALSIKLQ